MGLFDRLFGRRRKKKMMSFGAVYAGPEYFGVKTPETPGEGEPYPSNLAGMDAPAVQPSDGTSSGSTPTDVGGENGKQADDERKE